MRRIRHTDGTAAAAGFTLIEVLAALAILGASLVVLLESHYRAMMLFDETQEAVLSDRLMEYAIGVAETEILAGTTEGSEEFGARYPGCSFQWNAALPEEDEAVMLYTATVTVTGLPETEPRTMTFLLYDPVGYEQ